MRPLSVPVALERALAALFAGPESAVTVEEIASRPWSSATFSGARHVLRLRLTGDEAAAAADRGLEGIEDRDFPLPGQILIDIALAARDDDEGKVRLTLEALTVEAD